MQRFSKLSQFTVTETSKCNRIDEHTAEGEQKIIEKSIKTSLKHMQGVIDHVEKINNKSDIKKQIVAMRFSIHKIEESLSDITEQSDLTAAKQVR